MRRLIVLLAMAVTLLFVPLTGFADTKYVSDGADLLTDSQEASLEQTLEKASKENGIDIAVVTVYGLGDSTAESYVDLYFEDNYGENGALLLIDMETRAWHISTSGTTMYAVNDAAFNMIEDEVLSGLSDGNYYQAFTDFANDIGYVQGLHNEGKDYHKPFNWLTYLLASLGIGAIGGVGSAQSKKKQLKTVKKKTTAYGYEKAGTLNISNAQDIFLYSTISTAPIAASIARGSGGGGPTHTSSSGTPHGGGGGHF